MSNDRVTISVTNGDKEKLSNRWRSSVDPSAGTIEYGVRLLGAATAVATWVAGTVGGEEAWSASTETVTHLTPTLGASGAAIVLTAGTTYELWGRQTVAGEVLARKVAVILAE